MDTPMDVIDNTSEHAHEPATKKKVTYGSKRSTRASPRPATKASSLLESIMARHPISDDSEEEDNDQSSPTIPKDASDAFGLRAKLRAIDQQYRDNEESGSPRAPQPSGSRLNDSSSSNSMSTEGDSSALGDISLSSGANLHLPSSQTDPPSPTRSEKNARASPDPLRQLSHSPEKTGPTRNLFEMSDDSDVENIPRISKSVNRTKIRPNKKRSPVLESDEERGVKVPSGIKDKPHKIKKPTLREKQESLKEHARIMADRSFSVTKAAERFTVANLLSVVSGKSCASFNQSSDPIQDFTSSPHQHPLNHEPAEASIPEKTSQSREDSDDEMPNVQEVLEDKRKAEEAKISEAQKRAALQLKKLEALERQQAHAMEDSSESDLEIEIDSPKKSAKVLSYEKTLAGVAGFRPGRHSLPATLEGSQGEATLKRASRSTFITQGSRDKSSKLDHRDLQFVLRQKASKQSALLTKEKEEEWTRRGGKLRHRAGANASKFTVQSLAIGLAQAKKAEDGDGTGEADEGSGSEDTEDEDYVPAAERGSASPVEMRSPVGSDAENEIVAIPIGDDDDEEQQMIAAGSDESGDENMRPAPRHAGTRVRMVVTESEDEENDPQQRTGLILVAKTSEVFGSSLNSKGNPEKEDNSVIVEDAVYSEGNSDKENHENDNRSTTDSSGDKENAIPFSPSSPTGRPSLSRGLSLSLSLADDRARQSSRSPSGRRPLQERKLSEHDPFSFRSPKSLNSLQASPKAPRQISRTNSPADIRPMFGPSLDRFSQFFNEGGSAPQMDVDTPVRSTLKPAFQEKTGDGFLQPSFEPRLLSKTNLSDFFSQTTQQDAQPRFGGFTRPGDDISLTLETKELRPALRVTTQIRRNADALFEKEQEFVLEEAVTSSTSASSKPELYMLENGMLTQTKPDNSTPFVYRTWTPSQKAQLSSQATAPPTTGPRIPLGELSFASEPDSPTLALASPSNHKLSRLRKGKDREPSPSAAAPAMDDDNAFTRMMRNANRMNEKKKLKNNEFVEGEAMESDDDEMMGFGPKQKEVDDDSDDDPNEVVENLVDDTKMTEEQLARDRVLEKVQEHQQEDDAANEKTHREAIAGKFRKEKRRNGISMDDSESEDEEDYENKRRRLQMHKKRRVEGDILDQMANDEKGKPFYDAYWEDVKKTDDGDFSHLGGDGQAEDEEQNENENENENEPRPIEITTSDLHAQLREAAQRKKEEGKKYQVFDADDVSWAEEGMRSDDDDDDVAEIEDRPRRSMGIRQGGNEPEFDDFITREKHMDEKEHAQLKAWGKEHAGRSVGTGGLKGAITVTGHGPKGASARGRSGGRVMQRASASASHSQSGSSRRSAKAASGLARVSSKHSRFG